METAWEKIWKCGQEGWVWAEEGQDGATVLRSSCAGSRTHDRLWNSAGRRESNPASLRLWFGVELGKHSFFSVIAIVSCCKYLLAEPNGYPIPARYPTRFSSNANAKYRVLFRSTQNIRSTLNTWHARRYSTCTEIPDSEKGTQKYPMQYFNTSTRPLPACYPTFFSKPDPYQPNIEKKKKLPVGPCLSEPANIALVVVLAPKS